ncbi:MAG: hypothetical protein ABIN25_02470 [Ginsengibacter sp.]
MKKAFFFFLTIMLGTVSCKAQSDILVLKKNLRTIKTFFPGTEISMSTADGYYNGRVTSIARDSVYIIQYDIRQMPSNFGVYFLDTVATYRYGINYKQIIAFDKQYNKKFNWSGSGGALLSGGILLTTVGLGTWLFTKPDTRYYASPYLIGGAVVLAGIGYLLVKSGSKGLSLGKKYSLEYIHVK